jgi:peptide/nickel transport system substrate-binding protein
MRRSIVVVLALAVIAASPAAGGSMQTPPRGGTVVFGPIPEPGCLNPLVPSCVSPSLFWIFDKVLEPPFAIGPNFAPQPRLVSRVTFRTKPPFTLTYEIRPQARWSDGVPVTARDFVFTHQAIRKHLARHPNAGIHPLVRSIRAVDAKTVRVTLRSRDARWRTALFFFVLPQHALVGRGGLERIWRDRIDNPKTGGSIGNGPFLVERWERGKQLTLVRNTRYWGSHLARLDRIVIRFCQACTAPPPAQVLAALRQGEVDFALSRDTGIVPDLRRISGVRVLAIPSNGWEHLALRIGPGGHPALRSKLVRRALAYGIDRVAIARQLFGEIDPRYQPSDSALFLNTNRYYRSGWSRYRYKPALARRLLVHAGCLREADGIYSCAGQRLSLRFLTIAGTRLRERGLELIQSQLRNVGVEVLLTFAPFSALVTQILPGGDFDAVSFTWFTTDDLASKDIFGCGGPQNFTGYCQRLVTEDLDQADRILDASQRGRVVNRIDRQLATDVPVIPLYQVPFVLAFRKAVQNVVPAPNNLFWNAENWWLER